jgi:hypothetical protein
MTACKTEDGSKCPSRSRVHITCGQKLADPFRCDDCSAL